MIAGNRILEKVRQGAVAYGMYVRTPAVEAVELAGAAGLDFIRIDHLHGGLDPSDVANLVRAAYSAGVTPTIRIAKNRELVDTVLETGVMGLTFPDVRSADEAATLVSWSRQRPAGERSGPRPVRLSGVSAADYARWAADELMISIQIESPEGVAEAAAIADVAGIDMIHSGRADLAAALGASGATAPQVLEAERQILAAARAAGRVIGLHVPPGAREVEAARSWEEQGAQCVTLGSDTQILFAAIRDRFAMVAGAHA